MLRGKPNALKAAANAGESGPPAPDEAYAVEERPVGIRFYRPKESFFLPYGLLAAIRWKPERVTLTYAIEDVVIAGRGLHELYVRLAEHKVVWICEQGERYENTSEAPVHVRQIRRVPRLENGPAPAESDTDPPADL